MMLMDLEKGPNFCFKKNGTSMHDPLLEKFEKLLYKLYSLLPLNNFKLNFD